MPVQSWCIRHTFPRWYCTLGIDVFPEYVGWSLEGWNVDLTAAVLDRFDFSNLSGMFWGDLDLLDLGILYVFYLRDLDQDFLGFKTLCILHWDLDIDIDFEDLSFLYDLSYDWLIWLI